MEVQEIFTSAMTGVDQSHTYLSLQRVHPLGARRGNLNTLRAVKHLE